MKRKRKLTLTKKREIYGLLNDYYFKGNSLSLKNVVTGQSGAGCGYRKKGN